VRTWQARLAHRFVDHVPERLEPGELYISIPFTTAVHLCACGCGNEVVTPLSPTDWKVTFDGESVSLHPSIGNWSFPCQSHYWIRNNHVRRAPRWSAEKIAAGRARDHDATQHRLDALDAHSTTTAASDTGRSKADGGFRIRHLARRLRTGLTRPPRDR
jgi:hypothetical protein